MDEAKKDVSLWQKLYGKGKEVLDSLNEERNKRALKRSYESAFDSAIDNRNEAEKELQTQHEKMQELNVNKVVEARLKIKDAEQIMAEIKADYLEMFGEELKLR